LPAIGFDGQARIVGATVAVVGDDLTAEVAARALAAGGVGQLVLVRRSGPWPDAVAAAVGGSNPETQVALRAWPVVGVAWLEALAGCAAIVRSDFDDDPMLRAAVRLGIPVVVARAGAAAVDVVSFRRHGPCPHTALDVPEAAATDPTADGAAGVIAGEMAAGEILLLLAGALEGAGRAHHARIPLDGGEPRAAEIPWAPECFACGGAGSEMVLGEATGAGRGRPS